jgi:hypothetical protein
MYGNCTLHYILILLYIFSVLYRYRIAWRHLRWNFWTSILVEVSEHKLESLSFFSGFLPSFFRSTKCYPCINSSFLVLRIFFNFFLQGCLKPSEEYGFLWSPPVDGTMSSMEQKIRVFCWGPLRERPLHNIIYFFCPIPKLLEYTRPLNTSACITLKMSLISPFPL